MTNRNTPKHPGAMTPAEQTRQALTRLAKALQATALLAVAEFVLIYLLFT